MTVTNVTNKRVTRVLRYFSKNIKSVDRCQKLELIKIRRKLEWSGNHSIGILVTKSRGADHEVCPFLVPRQQAETKEDSEI